MKTTTTVPNDETIIEDFHTLFDFCRFAGQSWADHLPKYATITYEQRFNQTSECATLPDGRVIIFDGTTVTIGDAP